MANTEINQEDGLETVESAFGKTEKYIEENRTKLLAIVGGIVAVIVIIMAYNKFVKVPKEKNASAQMFQAENYFERDSFNLALNGDGNYPGFLGIQKNYSGTKAANLAHYYAAVCYYNLGQYDETIKQLKDFKCDEINLKPIALGLAGDAYMQKNDIQSAEKQYEKAAKEGKESFAAPIYLMKLGRAYEKEQKLDLALAAYKKIKDEYPNSTEGRQIEKYIESVNAKKSK